MVKIMANDENLIPIASRPLRERQEIARKGADATNKLMARRKSWKEKIQELDTNESLRKVLREKDLKMAFDILGETFTNDEIILLQQYIQAMGGNRQSAEFIRDTGGNKPSDKIEVATMDNEAITEFEQFVYGQKRDS